MATARYFDEAKDDGTQHVYGVPMRDITDDEYDALPKWLKAQVDASPLYRKSAPTSAAKKKSDTQEAPQAPEKPAEAGEG